MLDLDLHDKESMVRKLRKHKVQYTDSQIDFLGDVVKSNKGHKSPDHGPFGGLFQNELKNIQPQYSPFKKSKLVSIESSVEQISNAIDLPGKHKEEPQVRSIKSEKKVKHTDVLEYFDQFIDYGSRDNYPPEIRQYMTPVKFLGNDEESRKTPIQEKTVDKSRSSKRRTFDRYIDIDFSNNGGEKEVIKERWSFGPVLNSGKKQASSRKLEWNEC